MAMRPRWLRWYLSLHEDTLLPRTSAIFFPFGVLIWVLAISGWIWESPTTSRLIVGGLAIPAGVAFGEWNLSLERRAVRANRESGRTFRDLPRRQRVLIIAVLVIIALVFGYLGVQSEFAGDQENLRIP